MFQECFSKKITGEVLETVVRSGASCENTKQHKTNKQNNHHNKKQPTNHFK